MYLYIVKIVDRDGEVNFFGSFRSTENAKGWATEEVRHTGGSYEVFPLLDPHYINDAGLDEED